MVGEIRDGETAKMAIEAALTGHLVLSTLHTNDAPGALTRLNEMGVEPFLTGSAVTAVLAQRLARKLCSHCCEMYTPSVDELIKAKVSPDVAAMTDGMALYRKRGCPRCNQTGYRGRIGIFQLMTMDEDLADARGAEGVARGHRALRRWGTACARCGTTGSPRSRPASRRSKSSPALRRNDAAAQALDARSQPGGVEHVRRRVRARRASARRARPSPTAALIA